MLNHDDRDLIMETTHGLLLAFVSQSSRSSLSSQNVSITMSTGFGVVLLPSAIASARFSIRLAGIRQFFLHVTTNEWTNDRNGKTTTTIDPLVVLAADDVAGALHGLSVVPHVVVPEAAVDLRLRVEGVAHVALEVHVPGVFAEVAVDDGDGAGAGQR